MTNTTKKSEQNTKRPVIRRVIVIGEFLFMAVYLSSLSNNANFMKHDFIKHYLEFQKTSSFFMDYPSKSSGVMDAPTLSPTTLFREDYFSEEDRIFKGTLSTKPKSFFQKFQEEIDNYNLTDRCHRYGFSMKAKEGQPERPNRRIFYGALLTEEPLELIDIISTETHGIFSGVVFVESNRTQMLYPREVKRANKQRYVDQLKELFGVDKLQIREFVDEESSATGLVRENYQRQEILRGWKELGMTKDDIGYIADTDESFTRDTLRAIQYCPYVEYFDYEKHKCRTDNNKVRLIGSTRVFESSPECVTQGRSWFHPDMIIGACVEEIGDESVHPRAKRSDGLYRDKGWARSCSRDVENLPNNTLYPLWSGGDFRMNCGGSMLHMQDPESSRHTAFHVHNFFANFQTTRHRYLTYGHPDRNAMTKPLEELSDDIKFVVRCVYNHTDGPSGDGADPSEKQTYKRVEGGLSDGRPPFPIYFHDEDYRRRKHEAITRLIKEDEYTRKQRLNLTAEEFEMDELVQAVREAKRFMWAKEAQIEQLKKKIEKSKA